MIFLLILFLLSPMVSVATDSNERFQSIQLSGCSESEIESYLSAMGNIKSLKEFENRQLAAYKDLVNRSGDSFRFIVGKSSFSVKLPSEGDRVDYFINYFPESNFFALLHVYLEGHSFSLVSKNGRIYPFDGYPKVSPKGDRFLNINGDLVTRYNETIIQVFQIKNGELVEEFKFSPKQWEPISGTWKNNDLIFISYQNPEKPSKAREGRLIFDSLEMKWLLEK